MKPELILTLPARPLPYAVLGQPIHHSFSPIMQQAAFDHCAIDARYFRIEVGEEGLPRAVDNLRALPFGGWNCTVPNKIKMVELCDRLAPSAQRLKAVNTVVNENGTLVGHNTDGVGWSRALAEAFGESAKGARLLLLGAGGAARAIATQALLDRCAELVIANRKPQRAEELLAQLRREFKDQPEVTSVRMIPWADVARTLNDVDLVVNATAAGLDAKEPPLLTREQVPAGLRIYDATYGAAAEKLRQEVEAADARFSDGLGMLLHQGAEAFSLWTGREAPVAVMRDALAGAFSASRR